MHADCDRTLVPLCDPVIQSYQYVLPNTTEQQPNNIMHEFTGCYTKCAVNNVALLVAAVGHMNLQHVYSRVHRTVDNECRTKNTNTAAVT